MSISSAHHKPESTSSRRFSTLPAFSGRNPQDNVICAGCEDLEGYVRRELDGDAERGPVGQARLVVGGQGLAGEPAAPRRIEDVTKSAGRVHAGRQRVEERLQRPRPEKVLRQKRREAGERAVLLLHEHVGDEDLNLLRAAVAGVSHTKVAGIRDGGRVRAVGWETKVRWKSGG
jgi:hypothetical protein